MGCDAEGTGYNPEIREEMRSRNMQEDKFKDEQSKDNIVKYYVSGSCYVCGKKFAEKENTVYMYGEEVCQQCAEDEMYNMFGNGDGR